MNGLSEVFSIIVCVMITVPVDQVLHPRLPLSQGSINMEVSLLQTRSEEPCAAVCQCEG